MIHLEVPKDTVLPPFYTAPDTTPHSIALALKLGADAALYLQKRSLESLRQETHAEAIASATADFDAQLKMTTTKLLSEKGRVEEGLRAALRRIEAMEADAANMRSAARDEVKDHFNDLLKDKEAQISRLQHTLEKEMDAVSTRVEGLQHSLTKTFSSSKDKGDYGEHFVEGLLKRAYDCDIQVVAKEAQTADIRMTRPTASYFWESKNYTRMVSKEEIEKFRRDLRLHPDVIGGCLVSLRMGIVGKCRGGDIDVEFLEDGRFILFISNLMARADPVFYLQTLRPLFETVEAMARPIKEDAAIVRALEAKALLITNLLRSHSDGVIKHKNSLVGHRRRMDAMFAEFQGYILESEAQLQTLLRVAIGDESQQSSVQTEIDTALSSAVFKKERLADCDERQKVFVKWLLEAATFGEGQMELKDLIDAAKPKFSERVVRGFREELFQDSAWPKGSRFICGMQLNSQVPKLRTPEGR